MAGRRIASFRLGEFLLEPEEHRLTFKGEEIRLRPKNFDVLLLLVTRQGHLVSKEELLTAAWPDSCVTEGTLRQSIWEIREALGDHEKHQRIIKTVPKVGYKFVGDVRETERGISSHGSWIWKVLFASAIGVLLLAAPWLWRSAPQPGSEVPSIAVLPFRNLSPSPEDAYFSIGMTEEIIAHLLKIENLRVVSLTSVMRYKDTDLPLRKIAEELGVSTILEGSARQADGQVRITAQLIDSESDEHLWGETYEREFSGIFAIQSDVAYRITTALNAKLTSAEENEIEARPTDHPGAYNLYLRGRFLRYESEGDTDKVLEAVRCFEDSIGLDPGYALAYAGLAECHFLLRTPWRGYPDEERSRMTAKAEEAARRALELDARLPEAHLAWALIQAYWHFDWMGAEQSFRHAMALGPRHWNVSWEYGLLLTRLGRFEEAVGQFERALSFDPTSLRVLGYMLPQVYVRTGNTDQAIAVAEKLITLYPGKADGYMQLAKTLIYRADYDQAMIQLRKVKDEFGETSEFFLSVYFSYYGYLQALMGHTDEAHHCISKLEELQPQLGLGVKIARVYLGLGNRDEVFRWLEKEYALWTRFGDDQMPWGILHLNIDPEWEMIRNDDRFADLLQRINLPPKGVKRAGVWKAGTSRLERNSLN